MIYSFGKQKALPMVAVVTMTRQFSPSVWLASQSQWAGWILRVPEISRPWHFSSIRPTTHTRHTQNTPSEPP